MQLPQFVGEPGKDRAILHLSKNGQPLIAQAAIIDGFPSAASYNFADGQLHYSVPV